MIVVEELEMKILHAGNMANVAYLAVKAQRSYGIDAELLMRKPIRITEDPKSLDKELELTGYPDWIKLWNNTQSGWKWEILKHMKDKQYDLIHAYVELPIFAMASRRKFVAHTLGSDMAELAFSSSFKGRLLRRAYRKAKAIIFVPHHYPLLQKLGLTNGIYMPFPVDHEKFTPQKVQKNGKYKDKFLIFHPSHQIWSVKGNDRFLRAFIRLAKERNNVFLIMRERGENSEDAKRLLESAGMRDKVELIPTLKQEDLRYYYNLCDVVADHFIYGTIGGITLEALSCEKPVLAFILQDIYSMLYKEVPPVINVNEEEAIYNSLVELMDSESLRADIGKKSKQWIIRYNNKELFAKRCKVLYDGIQNNDPVEEIRDNVYQVS